MEETDLSSNMKIGLDLGLGLTKYEPKMDNSKKNQRVFSLDLSIPLHRSDLDHAVGDKKRSRKNGVCNKEEEDMDYFKNCCRKKLRLSNDQITLLEDRFQQHSTLTMAQKKALAEKLNLKPRQVEVWFQNRRARTKLKQTEIDCEFLKKKFERLSEENRHLHNQLLELRSVAKKEKVPPPPLQTSVPATAPSLHQLFYQMPKEPAIHRTCSSCREILNGRGGGDGGSDGRKKEAAVGEAVIEVINEG